MGRKLFRHNPLDKLAELDHLNKQLVVVNEKVKMIMLFVIIIILVLFLWSLFGKISIWVEGPSISFHPGKVYSIYAEYDGWVKGVSVQRGQIVEENQPLLEVSYPVLSDRYNQEKQQLSLLESEYVDLEKEVQKRRTAQERTTQIQIDLQKYLLENESEATILTREREAKIALLEQSVVEV